MLLLLLVNLYSYLCSILVLFYNSSSIQINLSSLFRVATSKDDAPLTVVVILTKSRHLITNPNLG